MIWILSILVAVAIGVAVMTDTFKPRTAHVLNRERAAGVHPSLLKLLDDWERVGWFDVMIAPDGGVRTDEAKQAKLYAQGVTKAKSLSETPHGRAAALDIWPVDFEPFVSGTWAAVPEVVKTQFYAFGQFAQEQGFNWGGAWSSFKDYPHVEVPNWRLLPFPPQERLV